MPTKKVFNWSFLLLLSLNFFFLSAILSSQIIQKGELVTLPDLVGKTMNEARQEFVRKKLSIVQRGVQFDDRWEKGKIVFQDPSAGSKIRVNKTIQVIISEGSKMIEIPKLVGKSLEVSTQTLHELGLVRGLISQIHTPQYAAGRVIAQDPIPSPLRIKRNAPVSLLVSQGEREERYLMPDLIGKHASAVIENLKRMEFKIANLRYSYYPGLESGIIIKQFPSQGYSVQKRAQINLEVSK